LPVVVSVANVHRVLCEIMFTEQEKGSLKQRLIGSLKKEREVCRIVVFGSFVNSDNPHDMDVAVFQNSDEKYLPLAMRYRRKTRDIARMIPMDILPLKAGVQGEIFMDEIERGEVIYERNTCGHNS
jgi:predicted nucleotidyltransferase